MTALTEESTDHPIDKVIKSDDKVIYPFIVIAPVLALYLNRIINRLSFI